MKTKILLMLFVFGINSAFKVSHFPNCNERIVILKKFNLKQGKWRIFGTNYSSKKQLEKVGINYDRLKGWFKIDDINCIANFQKKFIGIKAQVDNTITPDINVILVHNDSIVWEGHFLLSDTSCEVFNKREGYRIDKVVMRIFNCANPETDENEYNRLLNKGKVKKSK